MTDEQIVKLMRVPGYSEAYNRAMATAAVFFGRYLLPDLEPVTVSEADWNDGLDSFPFEWQAAARYTAGYVLGKHDYDLSYAQLCNAVLGVALSAGKIAVTGGEER